MSASKGSAAHGAAAASLAAKAAIVSAAVSAGPSRPPPQTTDPKILQAAADVRHITRGAGKRRRGDLVREGNLLLALARYGQADINQDDGNHSFSSSIPGGGFSEEEQRLLATDVQQRITRGAASRRRSSSSREPREEQLPMPPTAVQPSSDDPYESDEELSEEQLLAATLDIQRLALRADNGRQKSRVFQASDMPGGGKPTPTKRNTTGLEDDPEVRKAAEDQRLEEARAKRAAEKVAKGVPTTAKRVTRSQAAAAAAAAEEEEVHEWTAVQWLESLGLMAPPS